MTIVFALRSTPVHSLRPRFMAHTSRVSVLRRTSSMACRRPRLFRPPKTCHWRCCSWRCCCPGDVRSGQCASGHLDHGNIIYIYYMYICWLCLCVWLCLAIEIVLPPLWDAKKSSSKHFYGSGSSSPKEWPFDLSPRGESILFAVPPVPFFFLAARKYTNNLMRFCPGCLEGHGWIIWRWRGAVARDQQWCKKTPELLCK